MKKMKKDVLVDIIQTYREHIFKLNNDGTEIEYAAVDKVLAFIQTNL